MSNHVTFAREYPGRIQTPLVTAIAALAQLDQVPSSGRDESCIPLSGGKSLVGWERRP